MEAKIDSAIQALQNTGVPAVKMSDATALIHELEQSGWTYIGKPRGPFQTVELFPPMPMSGSPTSDCTECGGYVKMLQQHKHTAWHNKVADL